MLYSVIICIAYIIGIIWGLYLDLYLGIVLLFVFISCRSQPQWWGESRRHRPSPVASGRHRKTPFPWRACRLHRSRRWLRYLLHGTRCMPFCALCSRPFGVPVCPHRNRLRRRNRWSCRRSWCRSGSNRPSCRPKARKAQARQAGRREKAFS